eukprot:scaffold6401_cov164-Ochromonas_danica.AAC.5
MIECQWEWRKGRAQAVLFFDGLIALIVALALCRHSLDTACWTVTVTVTRSQKGELNGAERGVDVSLVLQLGHSTSPAAFQKTNRGIVQMQQQQQQQQ